MTNCTRALKYYSFARIREEAMLMRNHHFLMCKGVCRDIINLSGEWWIQAVYKSFDHFP